MEMWHTLARVFSVVDHQAVTSLIYSRLACSRLRCQEQIAKQRRIRGLCRTKPGNHPFRHDQNMDRSLGIGVLKRDDIIRFMDNVGRNLTLGNFLEDCHV